MLRLMTIVFNYVLLSLDESVIPLKSQLTNQSDANQLIKTYSLNNCNNKDEFVTSCNHYLHYKCYRDNIRRQKTGMCPVCRRCGSSLILLPILPTYNPAFRSRLIQTPCSINQLQNKDEFISLLNRHKDSINKQLLIDATVGTDYPFRVPMIIDCYTR